MKKLFKKPYLKGVVFSIICAAIFSIGLIMEQTTGNADLKFEEKGYQVVSSTELNQALYKVDVNSPEEIISRAIDIGTSVIYKDRQVFFVFNEAHTIAYQYSVWSQSWMGYEGLLWPAFSVFLFLQVVIVASVVKIYT